MKSIFLNPSEPSEIALQEALGDTYRYWVQLADFTKKQYPEAMAQWHYSGEKTGWSFRIKDQKRVIVYLLPRAKFFKAALVFGPKAIETIKTSSIEPSIKNEILSAKKYAEGQGVRIDVRDASLLPDLQTLIEIKLTH